MYDKSLRRSHFSLNATLFIYTRFHPSSVLIRRVSSTFPQVLVSPVRFHRPLLKVATNCVSAGLIKKRLVLKDRKGEFLKDIQTA